MQNYYATQSGDTAYDIKTVVLGYAELRTASGSITYGDVNAAKTKLTQEKQSLIDDGYNEIYNVENESWEST
jgi:hypothetical protein